MTNLIVFFVSVQAVICDQSCQVGISTTFLSLIIAQNIIYGFRN